jgi:hypothetical protein
VLALSLLLKESKVLIKGCYILAFFLLFKVKDFKLGGESRCIKANRQVFALIIKGNKSNNLIIIALSLN